MGVRVFSGALLFFQKLRTLSKHMEPKMLTKAGPWIDTDEHRARKAQSGKAESDLRYSDFVSRSMQIR
jgi:hypothetical protein